MGVHNIGKIGLTVSNQGHFGTGFISGRVADPLTGGQAPSCIYPYPGRLNYLFAGAFWIGAVVGRDTLVSVGADGWHYVRELWPRSLAERNGMNIIPLRIRMILWLSPNRILLPYTPIP